MALSPGTGLGACEILAPLGSGGMGGVYRARNPKLNRAIAIKILPETEVIGYLIHRTASGDSLLGFGLLGTATVGQAVKLRPSGTKSISW